MPKRRLIKPHIATLRSITVINPVTKHACWKHRTCL